VLALRRAEETAAGRRLVLAVYSKARHAPLIARFRRRYCRYVVSLLEIAPDVNDVVIWNEPNSSRFWRPQFTDDGVSAAAPAYEKLLAECWDDLHAFKPGVNVVAASAPRGNDDPSAKRPSESPVRFYTELAAAYRASGRGRREARLGRLHRVRRNGLTSLRASGVPLWGDFGAGTTGLGRSRPKLAAIRAIPRKGET
jgi:hypothetical protein